MALTSYVCYQINKVRRDNTCIAFYLFLTIKIKQRRLMLIRMAATSVVFMVIKLKLIIK